MFLVEKLWVDPLENRVAHGYSPVGYLPDEFTRDEFEFREQEMWGKDKCWSLYEPTPLYRFTELKSMVGGMFSDMFPEEIKLEIKFNMGPNHTSMCHIVFEREGILYKSMASPEFLRDMLTAWRLEAYPKPPYDGEWKAPTSQIMELR